MVPVTREPGYREHDKQLQLLKNLKSTFGGLMLHHKGHAAFLPKANSWMSFHILLRRSSVLNRTSNLRSRRVKIQVRHDRNYYVCSL